MSQSTASGLDQFDPATFSVVEPRTFEDLKVGDTFRAPSRTLTDAHATAFQAVSADNHPIHYDIEYAHSHGHTAPVVHGLQVLAFDGVGGCGGSAAFAGDDSGVSRRPGAA
jgi:acyl dehydratase